MHKNHHINSILYVNFFNAICVPFWKFKCINIIDMIYTKNIHIQDDEIMTDIRAQLVKLTPDEKQYFYHMIVSYIQLKEENARAQK